jgi:hypothetical protein
MVNPSGPQEQRREFRVNSELPATISVGTQLTIQGRLKDISSKSAFIRIKNSIFLQIHDEVGFSIQCSAGNVDDLISGLARVSRIVGGEGVAVYFTKMDDNSLARLKELVQGAG